MISYSSYQTIINHEIGIERKKLLKFHVYSLSGPVMHHKESMEDPDLICRVLSSASGKIANQSSSPTSNHPSKVHNKSANSENNKREERNYDETNDPLRILSNFSGSEDPYALLRELHILPNFNMDSSIQGVDIDEFTGGTRKPSFTDMIQCLEGKSRSGDTSGRQRMKESSWKEDQYFDINDNEGQDEPKCTSFNHLQLWLFISFLIQYLPVFIIAILYQIKSTASSSTSFNSPEEMDNQPRSHLTMEKVYVIIVIQITSIYN